VGSLSSYDHPNFSHDQFIAEHTARHEAAAKITAVALAITPQDQARKVDETRRIVGLYLGALLASRPDRLAQADRLAKTPWPAVPYYVNLVAHEKSTGVKAKVKRAKTARRPKSGTSPTPTGQQGQEEAILPTKERIYKAFANLIDKVEGAELEFYGDVAYKFVLRLVSKRMSDAGECATDQHDVTNRILFELSRQKLDKIQDIYKYLCSAAKKQGSQAFKENIEDRKTHVPLLVDIEDDVDGGGGETYKQDNPLIHLNELRPIFLRELPGFIEGDNLLICQYIRENKTYPEIAEITGMTLSAVKQRAAWMRNRIEEMRARGEKV
jgi:hypothetical protein